MNIKPSNLFFILLLKCLYSLITSLNRDEYEVITIKVSSYSGEYLYYNNKKFVENYKNDKMDIIEIIKKLSHARIHDLKHNDCKNIGIYEILKSIHEEIYTSEIFQTFINKYYSDYKNHYNKIDDEIFVEWSEKIEKFYEDDHKNFLKNSKDKESSNIPKDHHYKEYSDNQFFKMTFPCKYIIFMFPFHLRMDYYFERNSSEKPLFRIDCYKLENHKMIIDVIKQKILLIKKEKVDLLVLSIKIDQKRYTNEIEECECSILKKNDKCLNHCETFRFKSQFIPRSSNSKSDMCKRMVDYIKIFLDLGINEMKFPIYFSCEFNQFHIRLWKENFVENKYYINYSSQNSLFENDFQEEIEIFLTQLSFLSRVVFTIRKPEIWNSDIELSTESILKHLSLFFASLSNESLFYLFFNELDMKNQFKNNWEFQENGNYKPLDLRNYRGKLKIIERLFKEIDNKIEEFKINILKDLKIEKIGDIYLAEKFYPIRILKIFCYSYILSVIETNSPKFDYYLAKKYRKNLHMNKIHQYQRYYGKKFIDPDIYTPEEHYLIYRTPYYTLNYSDLTNPIDIILSCFNLYERPKKLSRDFANHSKGLILWQK